MQISHSHRFRGLVAAMKTACTGASCLRGRSCCTTDLGDSCAPDGLAFVDAGEVGVCLSGASLVRRDDVFVLDAILEGGAGAGLVFSAARRAAVEERGLHELVDGYVDRCAAVAHCPERAGARCGVVCLALCDELVLVVVGGAGYGRTLGVRGHGFAPR